MKPFSSSTVASPLGWWVGLVMMAVIVGMILIRVVDENRMASAELGKEPAGSSRSPVTKSGPVPKMDAASGRNLSPGYFLYDSSPVGRGCLISKAGLSNDRGGDLWFRGETADERHIADGVLYARFSPDGQKIAYATVDHEVVVESLVGEPCIRIARASEPKWLNHGLSLGFFAIPSLEYPELQHPAVYDLASGQVAEGGNEN